MTGSDIPFEDFGGDGKVIHIAHANGFPAACYGQLARHLTPQYKVLGMNARPLWGGSDHRKIRNWYTLAKDLIQFLDDQGLSGIIGIGHSFGSIITMIAANRRPDLFSKLVLIEPVILPKKLQMVVSFTPVPFIKRVAPIIRTAGKRTEVWDSEKAMFDHFRFKSVFSNVSDDILWDYVHSGTRMMDDGRVTLAYSREWETQIFATVPDPWPEIKKLGQPYLAIRGERSDALPSGSWNRWKSLGGENTFTELADVGHLVPFEDPNLLAEHILSFLGTER